MNDVITERTPPVIAAEINMIKYETEKMVLNNAIEIGRRLTEAKGLVKHGEWEKWLEESVCYAKSTAERLMRIFQEYGTGQPVFLEADAHAQALPNLSYTQALILLGVPAQDRAQFLATMDIESLSTRELQKAVEERKQALEENADLQQALNKERIKTAGLTTERDDLKTQAGDLRKTKKELEKTARGLQDELKSFRKSTSYQGVNRLKNDLITASIKAKSNQIAFLYETLDRTIKELKWELTNSASKDPETFITYKNKVYAFLDAWQKDQLWNRE